ncbi:MAG: methyltransferase domain-containing protein [Planctomycetota bacterium]|nr:methyltransferase domain-containing protein [Planctomycetota bacterium]
MTQFTNRQLIPEFMDEPDADRAELDRSLKFIRHVNAKLGGTKALLGYLKKQALDWPKDRPIRVLDVGTGSADIPLAVAKWAKKSGHDVRITGIDFHPTTLDLAREHVGDEEAIELKQCDALKLMDHFEPGSFDYAHAGMFLHHLPDIEVMTMLRIMDRLTTRALIWNDLIRSLVGKVGVRLMVLAPGTTPMVKHDAIVSVAKGFSVREARDLAKRADLPGVSVRTHLFHRFTLVSGKESGD